MYRSALHVQPDETDAAPEPVLGQGRMPCTIAVVSDGSALTHRGLAGGAWSVEPVLRHWAALIHQCTGLAARPVYLATQNAEDLSAALRGLPPDIGAVFLIHTDPARHWAATGSEQAGGSERPVITDRAMTAVAATAALLTTLRRRGLSPDHSRVVIAGAATMPVLRPLLLAAGFSCVTSWDRRDAVTFPLRWVTRNAEAVVDLVGCTQELAEAASDHSELIIITPDETSWTLLALPGLLRAAATAQDPKFDIAGYHACALALVAATPPDRLLPDPRDTALTSRVEQATTQALRRAQPCAEHTDVPSPHSPHPHEHTRCEDTDDGDDHRGL
jgi:malate dehydrogenase (oxaloacetate-decarboxylating)